jgi:hypothetical protein
MNADNLNAPGGRDFNMLTILEVYIYTPLARGAQYAAASAHTAATNGMKCESRRRGRQRPYKSSEHSSSGSSHFKQAAKSI